MASGKPGQPAVVQVGGAKLAAEQAAKLRKAFGCPLQQVFGMADGLLNYIRLNDPDDLVDGCQGRKRSPDDEVCILDAGGQEAEAGGAVHP
jgi:2,3-dihydroxybenzoate-AMP ligase